MKKFIPFVFTLFSAICANGQSYNCAVAIYSNPDLYRISNAVSFNNKITFLAAHSGAANFPGYPDPNSMFYKLTLAKDDGSVVGVESQSNSDPVTITSLTPQGNISMAYRKPNGLQYSFNGKYREYNAGGTLIADENTFPNHNYGTNFQYGFGSDGLIRGVSFSAAGYALIFHKRIAVNNWGFTQMSNYGNIYWNVTAAMGNSNALQIMAKWDNNGVNDLDYWQVDASDAAQYVGAVTTGIKEVYETQFHQNQIKSLFGIGNELRLITLNPGNATPVSNILVANNLTDLRGGRFAYRADGRLVVAYQTPALVKVVQETSAGSGVFSEIYLYNNLPTVKPMTPSLVVKNNNLYVVFANDNTVYAYNLDLPSLSVSILQTTASCSGQSNGTATVTVTGGATPYSFNWSNGQTAATATNLAPGNYAVTVTGSNGCTATANTTVATANAPTLSVSSTPACSGLSNGTSTVAATGGTTPYTYNWSNGQTTATAINLTQGTYTVTVTGGNGCTKTANTTVATANAPALSISSTPACSGQSNGTATVTATGGTTPYTFLWSNGQAAATATNLAPGTYPVTVTGGNGCTATASTTVTTANAPTLSVSSTSACPGQSNGTATVTAAGGSMPYTYQWSNNQNTPTATGLAGGAYTVTVTTASACSSTAMITISNTPSTQASFIYSQNNNTVTFNNTSTNATSHLWDLGDGQTSNQTSPVYSYAASGIYVVCLSSIGTCDTVTYCETILLPPPGWNPAPCNSGIVHTIGIESDVITNIAGQQLEPGDLVGFFYTDQNGAAVCNNMGVWTGSALVMEVCGDNPATTDIKEGYSSGENFNVKVWKEGIEYSVIVCYVPEDTYGANNPSAIGSFIPFGLSYIDCLKTQSDPGADLGCESPIPIACGETKTGDNANGAYNANTYSCFSNLVDGPEVVYQFVNPVSQNVLITLTGLQSDLELLVLHPCDRNNCIAYSDRTGNSPEAVFLEDLTPGTYFIVVEGYLGSSSTYGLTLQCGAPGNGGLNCANATQINCGQQVQGTTVGGSDQIVQWSCSTAYTSGKERIYSFVSAEEKFAFASLTGLTSDLDIFVLEACNPNNCIASSNKSGTENEAVVFFAPPGKLFYIVVDGYYDAEGSFSLSIPCVDPCEDPEDCPYEIGGPGNTQITNAQSLQCGIPVTGNNANGQANASYYSCPGGFTNGKEVVYKFENTVTQDVTIVLSGLSANLDLYLLSGPSIFNCHTASHKSGTSDEGIVIQALPAGTYFVVVDGYNGAISGYNLVVNCSNSTLTCQTIDLAEGTNFVSSNIMPLDPAINALFPPSTQSNIISVESQNNLSYSPYAQTDPTVFGEWDFRKAYRIKTLDATSFEICGENADPATPIQFVAQTPEGQSINNWIAYLQDDTALVGDKFTLTLTPKVFRVWNMPTNPSGILAPQSWSVTLQSGNNFQMTPGRGYILNATEDGEYTFGFWGGTDTEERSNDETAPAFVGNGCDFYRVNSYNSLRAATIILPKEVIEQWQSGYEIGIFTTDGALIGAGKYNGYSLSIVVTGDEALTTGFVEGFVEGEQMKFKMWDPEARRESTLRATFEAGDGTFQNERVYFVRRLEIEDSAGISEARTPVEWIVYPNPAKESAVIDIRLTEPSQIQVNFVSSNGRMTQNLVEQDMPAGRSLLRINTNGFISGQYYIRLTTTQGVSYKKIMISGN